MVSEVAEMLTRNADTEKNGLPEAGEAYYLELTG